MTNTSVIFGILLILIGAAGYVYGVAQGNASFTALIPAAFGAVLVIVGALASAMEGMRKHLMHVAVLVALIGFLVPTGRILSKLSTFSMSPAVLSQIAMAAVCLVFVVLAVRSFIAARRDGMV